MLTDFQMRITKQLLTADELIGEKLWAGPDTLEANRSNGVCVLTPDQISSRYQSLQLAHAHVLILQYKAKEVVRVIEDNKRARRPITEDLERLAYVLLLSHRLRFCRDPFIVSKAAEIGGVDRISVETKLKHANRVDTRGSG